jgi:hypothetical protein
MPFTRAVNVIKGRAKSLPPTSAGRVASYGTYDKVGDFNKEDRKAKKERKATAAVAAATASERREVEKLREQMPDLIAEQVQQKLHEIIPDELWEWLAAWNAVGRQGPLVVPSISSSNSIQHVSPDVVTPDTANIEAQPVAALVPPPAAANTNTHPEVALVAPPPANANTEQPIAPVPPPASAKAQPTVLRRKASRRENDTGVSTLAELNAISKVMTPASTFHFLCL